MAIRVQPRTHRAAPLEPVDAPPGPQQRVLHGVLGVVERAEHPVAVRLQLTLQGRDEAAERLVVAGLGSRELGLGHVAGSFGHRARVCPTRPTVSPQTPASDCAPLVRRLIDAIGIAAQRRAEPGLVDHLVHGLVQLERPQQDALLARVGAGAQGVAVAERRAVALGPLPGPPDELGVVVRVGPVVGRLPLRELVERGVVERAEHAGDVAQRRVRADALGERRRGLALEVDHQPAVRGAQRLPEVQVAVHALGGQRAGQRRDGVVDGVDRARRARPARAPRRRTRRAGRATRRPARGGRPRRWGAPARSSACTTATVSPSRDASAAKSPPTSSARRSPSASRSRTLAWAIAQPSAEFAAKSCSMAERDRLPVRGRPRSRPAARPPRRCRPTAAPGAARGPG